MNIEDLQIQLAKNNGRIKNVKLLNNQIVIDQDGPDPGMIMDIIGCYFSNHNECWIILMDFEPYMKYNESIASHEWYDIYSNPVLTWFETSYYKTNDKNEFYLDKNNDNKIDEIFEFSIIKNSPFTFYLISQEKVTVETENLEQAKIKFIDSLIKKGYVQIDTISENQNQNQK